MEVEHTEQHAEPAELDHHVLALAEFGDAGLPDREGLLLFGCVRPDTERAPDMVQDDRRLREGARQIGKFYQLRMI
jgi:hypothetical protein